MVLEKTMFNIFKKNLPSSVGNMGTSGFVINFS